MDSNLNDRETVTTRTIDAPRERVFHAFSDPVQLARWWGPSDFTNTFEVFDFRSGGVWRLTMHGPDGTDYPNESVFAEVVPPDRVVVSHISAPRFTLTITFTERAGRTEVGWRQCFESAEVFRHVAAIVIPSNEQNLDRLAAVVAGIA
jgi:uncharacterized protein YndB with AHSA1/START domain